MAIKRQPDLQKFIEIVEHNVPRGKIDGQLIFQGQKTTRLREGTPMRSYNSFRLRLND